MKKLILTFAFFLALCSCNKKTDPITIEKETSTIEEQNLLSLNNETFSSNVGIYFLGKKNITIPSIKLFGKTELSEFIYTNQPPRNNYNDSYTVTTIDQPKGILAPPSKEYLRLSARNLTIDQVEKLQKSNQVTLLSFYGTKKNITKKQLQISKFINALVANKDVIIVDLNTLEYFNPNSWNQTRVHAFSNQEHKDITKQVSLQAYEIENDNCRAITFGMDKFCLPNITIEGFPCGTKKAIGKMINALIQTMSENPTMSKDSIVTIALKDIKNDNVRTILTKNLNTKTELTTKIKLKNTAPKKGDPQGKQMTIYYTNDNVHNPAWLQQRRNLNDLFGNQKPITYVDSNNEELKKASEAAKKTLPTIQERFTKGLPEGQTLAVKAPFKTEKGGREWIWVKVEKWNGTKITGALVNDSFEIKNLKADTKVAVKQEEVFDYIIEDENGILEGNETEKFFKKKN